MARLRVAAAQINTVVGDLAGNSERILAAIKAAEEAGADLVALPELAITGYPPEDLLLRPSFVAEAQRALEKVAARTGQTVAVIGFPLAERDLYNAAAVCAGGSVRGLYRKWLLPNYGVFDEARYFTPSEDPGSLFVVNGVRVAVSICEDIWSPTGPIAAQAAGGAELAVNINASPYYAGRLTEREPMVATRAADHSVPILYVNLIGGQDELVFDGGSAVYDESGHVLARARQFEEDLLVVDLDVRPTFRKRLLDPRGRASRPALPEVHISEGRPPAGPPHPPRLETPLGAEAEVWSALRVGTGDYVTKNHFTDVVIGLSGGIDSSVVAALAVDALGAEHVTGVLMPSRYS
ncbi:MAG TPA: nitrilase-related carbon-nitrogen hydrolase, partial [Acidimicrobiia bacterium]|nr:nitrilase-related carbon-nitrogen hydrolase [Acidimicrobiia bacterium]